MLKRHDLPVWAPRLPKSLIRKLYENDAQGIYDEELIDKVGFRLYARCQSFLMAVEAFHGNAACPICETKIRHDKTREFLLECHTCNWELSWEAYFSTIQHKQLSGAQPVLELFAGFVALYPQMESPQAKMVAIDHLIHGFHYFYKTNKPTRPVAVNLIKGRLTDVIEFLDRLTYSNSSTPGLQDEQYLWHVNLQSARTWNTPQVDHENNINS